MTFNLWGFFLQFFIENYYFQLPTKHAYEVGGWGLYPPPPPRIFQIAMFGQEKTCNIRAKPLDIRASSGYNIRATDLSPPPPNETGPVRLCKQVCSPEQFQ